MDNYKPCRSKSPSLADGEITFPCLKPRGHKSRWHSHPNLSRRWERGINTPAIWELKDDGYMSEADWQSWGRFL